jgi:hypothetical protein
MLSLCRYCLLPEHEQWKALPATEARVEQHRCNLRHRFEDIAMHIQCLPSQTFRGQPDVPCSEVPELRNRMHALQDIREITNEKALSRARARMTTQTMADARLESPTMKWAQRCLNNKGVCVDLG